jgi:hypothetical protein
MRRSWTAVVVLALALSITARAGDPTAKSDVCYNNGFAGTGHVGLYDGSGKMLEAFWPVDKNYSINGTCVHYGKTLQMFKDGGGYKGGRYDRTISSYTLAQVYSIFKKQGDSYKATYSLILGTWNSKKKIWTWNLQLRPNTTEAWVVKYNGTRYSLEKKQTTGNAKLRCDFTVAASYQNKAGKNLVGTGNFLPINIFNNVPNAR